MVRRSGPTSSPPAVAAAADSDVAIVFVAMPLAKESEGGDRTDLDLTPQHVGLIRAVCAVQPRTVVVLFNGSAVAVAPWIDGTAAVLEAWLSGQAAGGAVADVLFGVVNPSGRLAETFPLRLEDTPAYLDFPGDGDRVAIRRGAVHRVSLVRGAGAAGGLPIRARPLVHDLPL